MIGGHEDDAIARLRYVRDMLPQLKQIAGLPHGSMLPYLLDMARVETQSEIDKRVTASRSGRDLK
ncbi:hypothetical protein FP2506_04746 [Fulvimarina pelagi HTCC2506]|uniref:Uncharacterized protein n=2 Tax=Fulvimarina pelagi TaxID=217511 RepID=Q0FZT3_9HYPH|nr:hypothetical protein [Fulvimarina pelagi]EAU40508.1 hypothetical protein FP2506_04746 [Fulvimarina pelagi HTCC2506]BAT31533.1 hypothetical protein [Fulvimarina pelagi]